MMGLLKQKIEPVAGASFLANGLLALEMRAEDEIVNAESPSDAKGVYSEYLVLLGILREAVVGLLDAFKKDFASFREEIRESPTSEVNELLSALEGSSSISNTLRNPAKLPEVKGGAHAFLTSFERFLECVLFFLETIMEEKFIELSLTEKAGRLNIKETDRAAMVQRVESSRRYSGADDEAKNYVGAVMLCEKIYSYTIATDEFAIGFPLLTMLAMAEDVPELKDEELDELRGLVKFYCEALLPVIGIYSEASEKIRNDLKRVAPRHPVAASGPAGHPPSNATSRCR
jgi:hypothetical protein